MRIGLMRTFLMIFFAAAVLQSCSEKSYMIAISGERSRLPNHKAFVVLNNNDTITGQKWDVKSGKGDRWNILLDGKKYIDSSLKGFQSQYGLAVRFKPAVESSMFIDQWAYYMSRGKVNVFSNDGHYGQSTTYNRTTGTNVTLPEHKLELYYKIDMEDDFRVLDSKSLKMLISDNPEAVAKYDASKIVDNDKKFVLKALKIIEVYNSKM